MPTLELPTGIALSYQLNVREASPSVVFVNVPWLSSAMWQGVEPDVSNRFTTLRYDIGAPRRASGTPNNYQAAQHAGFLQELLRSLELPDTHLVASGAGASAAVLAAAGLQDTSAPIMSLTTVGGHAALDGWLAHVYGSWHAALDAGGTRVWADVATPWLWSSFSLTDPSKEDMVLATKAEMTAFYRADVEAWLNGVLTSSDAKRALRAFEGPLLAAVGQEDALAPIRYSHEIVEWARQGLLVTVEQAGHLVAAEQPARLARLVQGFIDRQKEPG